MSIVALGLVPAMDIAKRGECGCKTEVAMTFTAPVCGVGSSIAKDAKGKILLAPGVAASEVRIAQGPPRTSP